MSAEYDQVTETLMISIMRHDPTAQVTKAKLTKRQLAMYLFQQAHILELKAIMHSGMTSANRETKFELDDEEAGT